MKYQQSTNLFVYLTVLLSLLINLTFQAEITAFANKCAACISANTKYYFSCNQCYDTKQVNYCGWSINNYLECPKSSKCTHVYIGDPDKLSTRSNYYSLDSGETCMIHIYNGMSDSSLQGMWKIWNPTTSANFSIAPSFNNTVSSNLTSYYPGDVYTLDKGKSHYLYVVNQGSTTINFKLQYGIALYLQVSYISVIAVGFVSLFYY
eukprot:403351327